MRTNLFIPRRFWTTYTNFDTCCQRYIATCGKHYIGAHTLSALNYCSGFSNPSAIYTKWCAQTFPPIFEFSQFLDSHFSEFVAQSSDENEDHALPLKGPSLLKNCETASKSTHTPSHNTCSNLELGPMSPLNEKRSGLGA